MRVGYDEEIEMKKYKKENFLYMNDNFIRLKELEIGNVEPIMNKNLNKKYFKECVDSNGKAVKFSHIDFRWVLCCILKNVILQFDKFIIL